MTVQLIDLGTMDYAECFELQRQILQSVADEQSPDTLLVVQHPPVYTLGANFHAENLPLSEERYKELGVHIEKTDRGGDITYHGPGQLVMYPIFNLAHFGKDLHLWLRNLEEATIIGLGEFGIEGRRFPPNTGVWVGERKICAIGIKVKRWTSMHGIALNCENDLTPFQWIVPCGIRGYGVTSIAKEVGRGVSPAEALPTMLHGFEKVFDIRIAANDRPVDLGRVDRPCHDAARAPLDA